MHSARKQIDSSSSKSHTLHYEICCTSCVFAKKWGTMRWAEARYHVGSVLSIKGLANNEVVTRYLGQAVKNRHHMMDSSLAGCLSFVWKCACLLEDNVWEYKALWSLRRSFLTDKGSLLLPSSNRSDSAHWTISLIVHSFHYWCIPVIANEIYKNFSLSYWWNKCIYLRFHVVNICERR